MDASGAGVGRREAIKKGAAAAAVGAVAWSAPRIEGFSLVPDYASAGTNTTGVITFRLDGNGPGLAGFVNFMNAAPSPAYTVNSGGPSASSTISMVAPLGPAGNARFTFPSGQDVDGPAVNASVEFIVDPPFNRCVILNTVADWDGSTSDRGQSNAPFSNQSPNTTSPRTVPLTFGPGPSTAGNNFFNPAVKINWIEVQIQCQ